MMSFDRIGGVTPPPLAAINDAAATAGSAARATMAAVGDRVLAWAAHSFNAGPAAAGQWAQQTGGGQQFSLNQAELGRQGDVYELRPLTAELGRQFGATPAAEGALGRAVEDFTRAVALRFNALAGTSATSPMIDDVAAALNSSTDSGPGGVEGITARIESATRTVEALNR